MANITHVKNPWRDLLSQQASFRDVMFHVETGARVSGRRTVVHEYPKRDQDYAEDMGQQAVRIHFSGYLIYRPSNPLYEYVSQRTKLREALEAEDAAMLVHPVFAPDEGLMAMCERYSMVENRTRGGYTEFEMQFVEAGEAGNSAIVTNVKEIVKIAASKVEAATKTEIIVRKIIGGVIQR